MWLTSFVEMALEPFSGGCGWGLPLLYKTWNIARRAKVTAEDKALNVRRTENLCTASSVLWKTNSGYCLLSNLNTKKFFFYRTSPFMWETTGSLSITNPAVKVKRRKHFLAVAGACNSALQPASPLLPLLSAGWAWTEAKAQNVFFPGISCHWGPLCFYGVTQDPPQLLSAATFCLSIHPKAWLWLTPKEQKFS